MVWAKLQDSALANLLVVRELIHLILQGSYGCLTLYLALIILVMLFIVTADQSWWAQRGAQGGAHVALANCISLVLINFS